MSIVPVLIIGFILFVIVMYLNSKHNKGVEQRRLNRMNEDERRAYYEEKGRQHAKKW